MIHSVDFDGLLCEARFPKIGEPYVKQIEFFKRCRAKGHKLILWTCRSGASLAEAVEWCKKWGLEFDAVNEDVVEIRNSDFGRDKSCKVYADLYWDDRNGSNLEAGIIDSEVPAEKGVSKCQSCGLSDPTVEAEGIYYCPNPFCRGSGGAWFRQGLESYESLDAGHHTVSECEWVTKAFQYTHQLPVTLRVKILTLPLVKEAVKVHMKGKLS